MLSSRLFAARVVKLVDTGDLKSPDHCDRAGSSPAPGTKKISKNDAIQAFQAENAFPRLAMFPHSFPFL